MKQIIFGLLAISLLFLTTYFPTADRITTTSGRVIQGTIVQSNADEILILADYGTQTVPTTIVEKIVKETDKHPVTLVTNTVSAQGRLPDWTFIVSKLATKVWAERLQQIPATVVINGILKNVPYISFRCGVDYEVNIYGDLDNPAGIEIGMYRSLLSKNYAKENAIAFVASILKRNDDQAAVKTLARDKDLVHVHGLTLEVTPETAEDAYGGWWISVYDEKALDQARASDKELQNISVLNSTIIKKDSPGDSGTWTRADLRYIRTSTAVAPAPRVSYATQYTSTDTSDYGGATPDQNHGSV